MSHDTSSLFEQIGITVIEMDASDMPSLQTFFEQNSAYFIAVSGQPATATEAEDELNGPLPEGWSYSKKSVLGFVDQSNTLIGMSNIVSDLLAAGVWHIGLFLVATTQHGNGMAQKLYQGLEHWAKDNGAQWLRLGVVEGNGRAEKFWGKQGYTEVRKREGVQIGLRNNTVRVLVKPLAGGETAEYLQLVLRDHPESE
jgi:GNAT superfamily N-acetyltransferase